MDVYLHYGAWHLVDVKYNGGLKGGQSEISSLLTSWSPCTCQTQELLQNSEWAKRGVKKDWNHAAQVIRVRWAAISVFHFFCAIRVHAGMWRRHVGLTSVMSLEAAAALIWRLGWRMELLQSRARANVPTALKHTEEICHVHICASYLDALVLFMGLLCPVPYITWPLDGVLSWTHLWEAGFPLNQTATPSTVTVSCTR